MNKPFRWQVACVLVGLIAGGITVGIVEGISSQLYPPPAELDLSNREALKRYISTLPTGAFLLVLLAHGLGAFVGGFVNGLLACSNWYPGRIIVGCFFLIAGGVNLLMIPHPFWFGTADILLYIPLAILGGSCGWSLFSSRSHSTDSRSQAEP